MYLTEINGTKLYIGGGEVRWFDIANKNGGFKFLNFWIRMDSEEGPFLMQVVNTLRKPPSGVRLYNNVRPVLREKCRFLNAENQTKELERKILEWVRGELNER